MAGGQENLIPNDQRTPEALKAMGAKGGRKSGETRRRKKSIREQASMILSLEPKGFRKEARNLQSMGYDAEAEGAPTVGTLILSKAAWEAIKNADWEGGRLVLEYAQTPDMRAKIAREKIKAGKDARKVALSVDAEELSNVMAEVSARMEAEVVE